MLGILRKFFGKSYAGGQEVASRQEMLRHTEFYQFPRQRFDRNSTPHQLHWAIRDALLDAGAKIDDEMLPETLGHWDMTRAGATDGEADYVPFSGSIRASKGESLPTWFYLILAISVASTIIIIGFFGLIGCWYWRNHINRFHRGKIMARYDGIYLRPENDSTSDSNTWVFDVDIMFSYNVEVPVIGQAIGSTVVGPVYSSAINATIESTKTGCHVTRSQPKLLSRNEAEFDARFPVQVTR